MNCGRFGRTMPRGFNSDLAGLPVSCDGSLTMWNYGGNYGDGRLCGGGELHTSTAARILIPETEIFTEEEAIIFLLTN